jgi:glyoxylase I family protein
VLGFVELFREDGEERRACVLGFAGGGFSVGVVEHRDGADDAFDPRRRGLDHLAFAVGARNELEGWAERLTARHVEHSGVIGIPPGAILNFKDPDGISLALFWDRPQAVE